MRLNLQYFGGRGSSGGKRSGGGGGSSYSITKEGSLYFARNADGYALGTGSTAEQAKKRAELKLAEMNKSTTTKVEVTTTKVKPNSTNRSFVGKTRSQMSEKDRKRLWKYIRTGR